MKKKTCVAIEAELLDEMARIKREIGIPITTTINFAIKNHLHLVPPQKGGKK